MAEIEITLPTVQYGNVKVRATPDELGLNEGLDAYELGVATAVYLNLFTQGFKHGGTLDVSAPQGASQGVIEAQAQRYLDEGLGGVTKVRSVEQIMSDEDVDTVDQARKIQERELSAPWTEPAVDSKPKPWENKEAPAKSVSEPISDEW